MKGLNVDKKIKIGLELDTKETSEKLKQFEKEAEHLEEKISEGLKLIPDEEIVKTEEGLTKIKELLEELESLSLRNSRILEPVSSPVQSKSKEYRNAEKEFEHHQDTITGIEKINSAKRINIAASESRYKRENLEFLLDITGLFFGKQAEAYKAVSIAEATISAYNAANAALLPPPIGAGPILGEIQAGIVLMNSLKRVEKIVSAKIPGYATGGIVVGENGPEIIENMQDYTAGRAELVERTILALKNNIEYSAPPQKEIIEEIKNLRADLNISLNRPAIAYLDDREAKKIYYSGNYSARKNR